ncbi:MAG: PGPGW domain-containing protein [Woeseia sp.]
MRSAVNITYRFAKRIVIGLIGGTVLLVGVIMLVTPGPAFVVIPVGLGILAVEFAFARRWLRSIRRRISESAANGRARLAEARRKRTNPVEYE